MASEDIAMVPGSPEVPPGDDDEVGQISQESSPKNHVCNLVALVAFWMTLVPLGLSVVIAFVSLRSLGLWQLGGRTNPAAETLAFSAFICLFVAGISNVIAFAASLWAWRTGTSKSVAVLWISGVLFVASVGCGLSLVP